MDGCGNGIFTREYTAQGYKIQSALNDHLYQYFFLWVLVIFILHRKSTLTLISNHVEIWYCILR